MAFYLLLVLATLLQAVLSAPIAPNVVRPLQPGSNWKDSYSVDGKCYCISNYDHGIRDQTVNTPKGRMTIEEVCELLGPGPGVDGNPVYNDIQCGNGPANDASDETDCPGRVDKGSGGCMEKGPKWDLSFMEEKEKDKVEAKTATKDLKTIPGMIEAEDFDKDEGIKLQGTSDNGGGQNIAYVTDGEYVEYNVNVEKAGTYKADFRLASSDGGGKIIVTADGDEVAEFDVKESGGWQEWFTKSVEMKLKRGSQTLRLLFQAEEGVARYLLNVNWIKFSEA